MTPKPSQTDLSIKSYDKNSARNGLPSAAAKLTPPLRPYLGQFKSVWAEIFFIQFLKSRRTTLQNITFYEKFFSEANQKKNPKAVVTALKFYASTLKQDENAKFMITKSVYPSDDDIDVDVELNKTNESNKGIHCYKGLYKVILSTKG